MKRILILLCFLATFEGVSIAQGWRGIKPLRSTCEQVKQILKVDKCEYPDSIYRFEDETVTIRFVTCPCPTVCDGLYGGWNVPRGTVAGITRELHKTIPVAEFQINSGRWSKTYTDMIGQILYDDHEAGIRLSAIDGNVVRVTYYAPLEQNEHLLCPKCSTPERHAGATSARSLWLTGYGDLSFDEEKKHLDKFAMKLLGQGSKAMMGYIVAYGGCLSPRGEARKRAQRAKQYLVSTYGIGNRRVVIIDGGQHESFAIELHVRSRSLPPPRTSSSKYPRI